jgi:DNA repair exonuclease SbcCD nuclease subunit
MIRLVWRTDVHLSDQPPVSRRDDWAETIFGKLRQVALVAGKVGASAILDGGDFFHVKSPTRNSHALIRRVAEEQSSYPCPVYGNVGNHDCIYGDYSYLDQQPLGVLFATGVFHRCYDDHEAVFEKDGVKVRVVGVPYHGTVYDYERFRRIQRKDETHLVCMAHVLASPSGGAMFENEDIVKYHDLTEFAPDTFLFGHWHKDQGVVNVGYKVVVNIGSLTRGALSQDESIRRPACAVLSFEQGKPVQVRVVRLKVSPVDAVFDVEGRIRAESRTMTMDAFVESVRKKLIVEKGKPLEDVIASMEDVPPKVRERVLLYLEQAGART